jgi:hypothetical protein
MLSGRGGIIIFIRGVLSNDIFQEKYLEPGPLTIQSGMKAICQMMQRPDSGKTFTIHY